MKVEALDIPDVKLIEMKAFRDNRGTFSESWNRQRFANHGIAADFVQDNHVHSVAAGVVRGLHFQAPPYAQGKLVRVIRGAIQDVAVDIRKTSPSFGRHVRAVISAENGYQIWVPEGFAHGYITLTPDTEVLYKVTNYYAPQADYGIRWNDPALAIDWQCAGLTIALSDKDRGLPLLEDVDSPF
jgi:dTDP-4-dehydrorhamnose 3,5-epimerase